VPCPPHPASLTALLLLAGCSPDGESGDPGSRAKVVELTPEHSPTLETTLRTTPSTALAERDLWLDWTGLDRDLAGRSMDPATGVTELRLFVFNNLDPEEVIEGLASDSLEQADLGILASQTPQGTGCSLSGFELLGHWILPETDFVPGSGTWLVELLGGDGVGLRSVAVFQPSPQAEGSEIRLDPDSAVLEITADLASTPPTLIPEGADVTVDWSDLEVDALGSGAGLAGVNRAVVARYTLDHSELGARVLELDSLALESWAVELSAERSLSLDQLEGERPFPGVDHHHRWLLSLRCDSCALPVPRLLVPLKPEG
jgi:hypothetical protein